MSNQPICSPCGSGVLPVKFNFGGSDGRGDAVSLLFISISKWESAYFCKEITTWKKKKKVVLCEFQYILRITKHKFVFLR